MKAYSEYKPSGIDWLGEIPSHWDVISGKWAVNFTYGFPADSKLFSIEKKGLPLIRIRDIYSTDTEVYYEGNDYPAESIIINGDLLIGMDGDFNVARWNGAKAILNQRVCKFEDSKVLSKNYMFYILPLILNKINAIKYATTVKHLSATDLSEMKLTVPPIEEQEVIAAYLDDETGKVDALIAEKQKQVEDLRAYRASLITETVTRGLNPEAPLRPSGIDCFGDIPKHWNVVKLKYALSEIKDGTHFSPDTCEEGYSYVTATDVRGIGIDYASTKKVNESNFLKLRQTGCEIFKNDVLLVKDGATTGRVGYKNDEVLAVTLSSVAILRVKKCDSAKYLMYLLESKTIQSQISDAMAGAAMPRITLEKLGNFIGIVPPISEQQAIAEFLDKKTEKIDALIDELNKQLDELAEYKKAVISEAVTGKVDVRDWTPKS